ncbi:MAG: hypothetical protein ACYC91_09150 [Solirubrobacteraceae bacterium]
MNLPISTGVRNVAIILVLAALVVVLPGGGTGAGVVGQTVSLAFLAAIAWVASRLYREHRVALYSLGDRRRAVLYAAVAVVVVTLTASHRLLSTGPGTVVWIVLIAGCAYAVLTVIWSARRY